MSHVSPSELRQRMAFYLDAAVADREPIVVTRGAGKGDVVLVAADEFDALQETVHLLSSPANAARLLRAVAADRAGLTEIHELIEPSAVDDSRS